MNTNLFQKIDAAARVFTEQHYIAPLDYEYLLIQTAMREAALIAIETYVKSESKSNDKHGQS